MSVTSDIEEKFDIKIETLNSLEKETEKEEQRLYVEKKDQTSQVEPVKEDAKES